MRESSHQPTVSDYFLLPFQDWAGRGLRVSKWNGKEQLLNTPKIHIKVVAMCSANGRVTSHSFLCSWCLNRALHSICLLLLLSLQSCPTLCDPIDGSPPGSPVPGILQARTLEWVAISVSNACKWKGKVKSLSRVRLLATPWTAAYQAPPSMGFSRLEWGAIAFSVNLPMNM